MCTFMDCDWQMKAPLSADMSITTFCLISHTVLYRSWGHDDDDDNNNNPR